MSTTAYWTLRIQRETLEAARAGEIQSLSILLGEMVTVLLEQGQLSTVRRLVTEAGHHAKLSECRLVLAGGQVVAAANPSEITLLALPPTWSAGDNPDPPDTDGGRLRVSYPLTIPGRGKARLEITAAVEDPFWRSWEAQAGVGVIGALALIAVWLVYRRMRSRLQPLGLIREALLAIRDGEQAPAALVVNDRLGEEARAWNSLVTEMERANKQLVGQQLDELVRAREEHGLDLNSACDAMWYGVLLVDSELRVTYANGAAAIYLRTKRDTMPGAKLADLVSDQHVTECVRRLFQARVRHRTAVELDKRGDSGSEVLRFTARAIGQDDPTAAIIVIEDVTQQRVADESRNAFVTQVTHELRSPLTNIRLSAETAIEDGEQNPPMRAKCLNVINQEAKRLERVVSDMLSVAEIEAGTLELHRDDVRLAALFEELQSDYGAQANDKGVRLEFNLPPKLPVIKADRDKISLVLHNLVNNAIKYTRKGGRVIVNVDIEDGALLVDVIDTGIGIAKDDIDLVFQKFYRAKDPRVAEVTGSGLGLALARQVVRLHGGEVRVDSEPDKGSTFSVRLPIPARAA